MTTVQPPSTPLVPPGPQLDAAERARYARQIALPQVGEIGQRRLKAATALVAGAGGIGSPVLSYLAAAGIGSIVVVDPDVVEPSNRARQLLLSGAAEGAEKATAAAAELGRTNPLVTVLPRVQRIDDASAPSLVADVDLVLDGTDDPAARVALHDAAAAAGIPYVWGTAVGTDAMVSVFWTRAEPPVTLRDLHPDPLADTALSCEVSGILGPVCAAVGSVMAAEAIKLIVGFGEPLLGRVAVYDALDATWVEVPLGGSRRTSAPTPTSTSSPEGARLGYVTASGLRDRLDAGEAVTVIDLREATEDRSVTVPGAGWHPLSDWTDATTDALPAGPIVLHCASGVRSQRLGEAIVARTGRSDVLSLAGGAGAWLAS